MLGDIETRRIPIRHPAQCFESRFHSEQHALHMMILANAAQADVHMPDYESSVVSYMRQEQIQ